MWGKMLGPFSKKEIERTQVCHMTIFIPSYGTNKTFSFLRKPLKIIESYFIFLGKSQKLSSQKKNLRKTYSSLNHTSYTSQWKKLFSVELFPNFQLENDSVKGQALLWPKNTNFEIIPRETHAYTHPQFHLQNEYTKINLHSGCTSSCSPIKWRN